MASAVQTLPDAMVSPKTGEVLRRDVRPFIVSYKGRSKTVDLPGYYRAKEDDGVHVGDDMNVTDIALRALKEDVEGIPAPTAIKCVSHWPNLSLRKAGGILKVGEDAFDKYTRGLVEPSGPTSQLLGVLDRHSKLVDELCQQAS
ncbi:MULTISPECIES: type II toxin-antitoxin system MqsA family antitoxin [Rhizobium]|uniref:HTH-type transcriptional regulator/antitoxin MqsA n=1 Tax=Rhizobium wenxiniae TaxID=1737357 RepID=A0A7X0D2N5_9HYPH|nr:type II toxin-antitoxin system MqsA family antitoxin [Rhizobium wenxiniae]MBB6165687.1 HTH-type transcriptional regulator/antitoxin MqsA [Rhizobium wenxiniae]GGG16655.1 hypothetical protein GCM10010924_52110 [Rhizobium wenxiniae]